MKPLVLIHGFTGCPAGFDRVLDELGPVTHLLRPTLFGHHGSSQPVSVESFRGEVDRLASRIADWAPGPAYVVGYSLGARLTLGLLVHHPGLFAGATLIGANPGVSDPEHRTARAAADDRWRAVLDRGDLEGFINAWSRQPLFETQRNLPDDVLEKQRRERLSHSPSGLSQSIRLLGLAAMPCYRSALGNITTPVEVLVGELDRKFLLLANEIVSALPDARRHVAPGAGHNLLLEAPAEVARVIRKGIMP